MTTTIRIPAARFEDYDDSLAEAERYTQQEYNAIGWDMNPRWANDERDEILLDVPGYGDDIGAMFYRLDDDGNAQILYSSDGAAVTQLDENIYPVGSSLSARYEHPEGIVLSVEDARSIGIPHEDDPA